MFRILWLRIRFVPDREKLWRAVYKVDQVYKPGTPRAGKPKPAFFRDKRGLSFDLARFSTRERSRTGHAEKPHPTGAGLVEFTAAHVRAVGSDVHHKPVKRPKRNYAHGELTTFLDTPAGEQLSKASKFVIEQRLSA